ncbi:hypothetical protein IWQ57_001833 [Coemansia nantahalensis]|uniref:Uncharacterized protein n=1 Tax=Coemansia nantahalensis TaxID=2789366 RepID=A0ACC1K2G3_9FUNG|nr:hypothetical protein IWQ57_001833 [Coemansia nantahalensis]
MLSAITPGDLFAPLDQHRPAVGGGFFDVDSFKGPGYLSSFASLLRPATDAESGAPTAKTPSLSDIFVLSPPQPSDRSASFPMPLGANSAALLPPQMQAGVSLPAAAAGSGSEALPAYLMAYRNPDPFSNGDDGDQLEKLLLNSMYPASGLLSDTPAVAQQQQQQPALDSDLASLLALEQPGNLHTPESSQNAGADKAQPLSPESALPESPAAGQCTCRNLDKPCDPCPMHGTPEDLSSELRGMAPEMMGYVCTPTNRMADDDLNDLCSLMYKHAKCTEMQRRVETVRTSLKAQPDLTLLQTKQQLSKDYGLE